MGSRAQAWQLWYTVQLLCGMWNLPRPGIESAFLTLAGISSTTGPPEKSLATSIFHPFLSGGKKQRDMLTVTFSGNAA